MHINLLQTVNSERVARQCILHLQNSQVFSEEFQCAHAATGGKLPLEIERYSRGLVMLKHSLS
jgi:hypothetical protein